MEQCGTRSDSAVQGAFGNGIEPANSVLEFWGTHLEVGHPGAGAKSHHGKSSVWKLRIEVSKSI